MASEAGVIIRIPIHTDSESNQREHWARRAKRVKLQRAAVFYELGAPWAQKALRESRPLVVILTRIAPRTLDPGNLESSLKAVQDGVADWLAGNYGKGQDRQPGLLWRYAQRRGGTGEYAVEISVTYEEGENHASLPLSPDGWNDNPPGASRSVSPRRRAAVSPR